MYVSGSPRCAGVDESDLSGTNQLNAVSCPSATFCAASDDAGPRTRPARGTAAAGTATGYRCALTARGNNVAYTVTIK